MINFCNYLRNINLIQLSYILARGKNMNIFFFIVIYYCKIFIIVLIKYNKSSGLIRLNYK